MAETGVCDSCGRDDELVVAVQRYYVTPEAWDTEGKVEAAGEERWCFSCRTHYPHVLLVEGDPGDAAAGPNDAPT